ncbi:MAG TPA: hypothetical protein VFO10_24460 [Oligoflexus sp.]|uniref:hypothetical protein n=1 Tax=Oligoflexus sp. TaxID=1971216 RepID=UPI002D7E93A5|nr:hypothetical protein [Oligoflexus sp.]HET9240440.1 hypothetical protein [Oligoflexus sp.]
MSKMGMISAVIGLAVGTLAQASTHSTKWTLRNEAKDAMTLACRNTSALEMEIVLPEQTLAAGEQIIYDWGDRFYNDGLWLNPGTWTCVLKSVTKKSRAERTETFATDWGEAITLVLSRFDDQPRLRKIPMKTPIATKDGSESRTKGSK